MSLTIFHLHEESVPVEPATPRREWMDQTPAGFAYRCLPLAIANAAGWELKCPTGFTAVWNGQAGRDAVSIVYDDPTSYPFATSWFGSGVITFHSGLLLKTEEGVSAWVKGSPNHLKSGAQALEAVVQTSWLPFPFTMNWRMLDPGRPVRFEKGEPFGFMTLMRVADLECEVIEGNISDDPAAHAAFEAWRASRADFTERLEARDPEAVQAGWQKHYTRGEHPAGTPAEKPTGHVTRVRTKAPTK